MIPATTAPEILERSPFRDHDGASGARLERARLADGSRVILKRFDPAQDLTMALPPVGEVREIALWRAGVLDRLPPPIGHAIVGAWREEGFWVLAMRDLSATILGWESRISRAQCRRVIAAALAMHERFRGEEIEDLLALEDRVAIFSPRVMGSLRGRGNPLPDHCLRGWERFADIAPRDVADLVFAIHEHPGILAEPLRTRSGSTLLHGDLWLPNIALEPDRVVVIDWALATQGPPIIEFASFLAGCASQVSATREEILDDIRRLMGERHDEDAMRLGLVQGVVEMGWNMALHATEHGGTEALETFEWWVGAARRARTTGLLI